MKSSCISQGLVVAAALALTSSGAFSTELRALSETEMSAVYGQGLSDPALNALGALSTKDQGNAALSSSASDALAGLAALTSDAQNLDRQQPRAADDGHAVPVPAATGQPGSDPEQALSRRSGGSRLRAGPG